MHYGSFLRTLCILLDTYWIYLDVFLLLLGALWIIHVMLVCVESFVDGILEKRNSSARAFLCHFLPFVRGGQVG